MPAQTQLLSYGLPEGFEDRVLPGMRVVVPLRQRQIVGVVWARLPVGELGFPADRLRPLLDVLDVAPSVPASLRETLSFIARYYHAPLGEVVRTAVPAALRRTGVADDRENERRVWTVAAVTGVDWPTDLRKPERRVLERLAARNELPARDLRCEVDPETGATKVVQVPQQMLEGLAARGLLRLFQAIRHRDPMGLRRAIERDVPPVLNSEQGAAVAKLCAAVDAGAFTGQVLRGVTGSGKTEVYLHVIERALALGRGAIVLVPEIALTPQLVTRFRARFGDAIAVLHSAMSEGERHDQLVQVRDGGRRIVIGARSAVFAPVDPLGVIVVDECQDGSFKQATGLRYHARDVALVRCRASNAVCILGSATPSCEEMHLSDTGRLGRIELTRRVEDRPMPEVTIVDLRYAERLPGDGDERPSLISRELLDGILEVVGRGEQALLLHNRRGFATTMICRSCGAGVECPKCAVTLTLHRGQRLLRCHYCDHASALDLSCPTCGGHHLVGIGAGTEKLESVLASAAPGLRVARFDRDTAQGRRLIDLLDRFRNREIDVLVGTQMLAKGHDFPGVTLVGVLLAESGLRIPDFRAAERTFQLITQVAGRAGRADRPGRVLVQTFAAGHPAIRFALGHDHEGFVRAELRHRADQGYPPFGHLVLLETRATTPEPAWAAMHAVVNFLRDRGAEVRGPVAAGLARLRGMSRVHALMRHTDRTSLHASLAAAEKSVLAELPAGVTWLMDVDPVDFA